MNTSRKLVGYVTLVLSTACTCSASDLVGFEKIFDGVSLDGWHAVPDQNLSDWSVKDGVLLGKGSEDKLVYLMFDEPLENFELKLKYRLPN